LVHFRYYAIRTGVDRVISPDEKVGLDVRLTLMPEYLRRLGYRTYAVGK
jgi:arylsulfatase A-like enzyme